MATIEERMKIQRAEFDACAELAKHYRCITQTPPVDDDYPSVRYEYDRAVGDFLKACKDNGRDVS
jgi:hypothetical protein